MGSYFTKVLVDHGPYCKVLSAYHSFESDLTIVLIIEVDIDLILIVKTLLQEYSRHILRLKEVLEIRQLVVLSSKEQILLCEVFF